MAAVLFIDAMVLVGVQSLGKRLIELVVCVH